MKPTRRDRPLYMISVAADLAGVHPQTLRIYERKALIRPKRSQGNTRLYSDADIEQLRLIQQLTQDEGINLAGVMRIMEMRDEIERLREELALAQERLLAIERAATRAQHARQAHSALVRIQRGAVVHRRG